MDADRLQHVVLDVLMKNGYVPQRGCATKEPRRKLEFSKWLMLFAAGLCAATWVIVAVSWFLGMEFPAELIQYTVWFFGAALPSYMIKTGYENKPKILKGQEGGGR